MWAALTSLLLLLWFDKNDASSCGMDDWSETFGKKGYTGWATCDQQTHYINGIWRSANKDSGDGIDLIKKARCCQRSQAYRNDPSQCAIADWSVKFDRWDFFMMFQVCLFFEEICWSACLWSNKISFFQVVLLTFWYGVGIFIFRQSWPLKLFLKLKELKYAWIYIGEISDFFKIWVSTQWGILKESIAMKQKSI